MFCRALLPVANDGKAVLGDDTFIYEVILDRFALQFIELLLYSADSVADV